MMIIWHSSIARMSRTSLFTILTRSSWTIIEIKQSLIPKIWSSGIGRTGSQFAIRQWAALGMMCKSRNYDAKCWRRIFQLEWVSNPKPQREWNISDGRKSFFGWSHLEMKVKQTHRRQLYQLKQCWSKSHDILFQEIELKSYHTSSL